MNILSHFYVQFSAVFAENKAFKSNQLLFAIWETRRAFTAQFKCQEHIKF